MDSVLIIKIISALIYPLGSFVLLLLVSAVARGLRWQRLARLCFGLAWAIFLLASNPIVASKLVRGLEQQYPQVPLGEVARHDAVLVLGGGLRAPQSPALYTQLSGSSDRYWHAARLFKAGKANLILLAGGNVFEQRGIQGEAFYAAELLQKWGVPSEAIKIETLSRTTEQNARNIEGSLRKHKVNSLLLVTSAYHMPRAVRIFESLPVTITPASADILVRDVSTPTALQWLPSVSALGLSTVALHEYYGVAFMGLKQALGRG